MQKLINTPSKIDEAAFEKQLMSFEAAMEQDLKQQKAQVEKKWEINLTLEKPTSGQTMSW